MRIRDKYYGAIIYATPGIMHHTSFLLIFLFSIFLLLKLIGSGKSCLAKAHRDVLDGDSIYVQAMRNVVPSFRPLDDVDDRVNIYRFYKYVKFDPIIKRRALKEFKYLLTKKSKDDRFIILIGTVQLMHLAHYVYIQEVFFHFFFNLI